MSAENKPADAPIEQDTTRAISETPLSETDTLSFLDAGQDGAVDLDALFDALNIAASHDGGAMDYVAHEDGGGTLIISGTELAVDPGIGGEDLALQAEHLLKAAIVSDES
ncbi:MAG: hypothetical protein EP348_04520 [Alphaproteobacteria bacterium]|nr:MAG: hypothetical protein EP348_04520 [Alphaproteobacteria bacterium]